MDFFHQSDGSQTNSDISEDEDEHLSGAEREEDILLRDCLLHHHLPQKTDSVKSKNSNKKYKALERFNDASTSEYTT